MNQHANISIPERHKTMWRKFVTRWRRHGGHSARIMHLVGLDKFIDARPPWERNRPTESPQ